jgi:hypothetical protein
MKKVLGFGFGQMNTVRDSLAVYSLITYTPAYPVWLLTIALWLAGDLGIHVGYYRLWYQNSFQCQYMLRAILAIFAGFAQKGSIKEWLMSNGKEESSVVDPVVVWQHDYFPVISIAAWAFPAITGYLLNDLVGGILYGIFVSRFLESYFWHWIRFKDSSQMLNSGRFTDGGSAYDLDKVVIRCAIYFGLAKENDLGVAGVKVVQQAKNINEDVCINAVPWNPKKAYTMDEFNQLVKDYPSKNFSVISRQILDITGFDKEHPGGARYINFIKGIDGTHEFYGSLHRHSDKAKDWVRSKKFADLIPGVSKAG